MNIDMAWMVARHFNRPTDTSSVMTDIVDKLMCLMKSRFRQRPLHSTISLISESHSTLWNRLVCLMESVSSKPIALSHIPDLGLDTSMSLYREQVYIKNWIKNWWWPMNIRPVSSAYNSHLISSLYEFICSCWQQSMLHHWQMAYIDYNTESVRYICWMNWYLEATDDSL